MKTLKRKTQKIQRRVKKYAPGGMYADNTVSGAGQINSTANIVYNESNPAILQQKMANFDNVKNTEIANSKQVAQDIATKDAQSKQEILNTKAQSDASFQQGESLAQTGADVYSKFSEMEKAKELKLAEEAKLKNPAASAVATAETAKTAAAKSIAGEGFGNAARSASASEVSSILANQTASQTSGATALSSNIGSNAGTFTGGFGATPPVHPSLLSGTTNATTGLSTASTGLGVNAAGTTGANAATTGLANVGTIAPMPTIPAGLPAPVLPGPITSVTPGVVAPGAADLTTKVVSGAVEGGSQAASRLAGFGGAGVQGAGTLAKFASSGAGIGMIAGLAGMGISKLSDDGDATKSNFGEYSGSVLSAAGTGASIGSLFGPVGTLVGGVGGAIYGGVKQFVGTRKAKRAKEKYERERALEVGKYNKDVKSNILNARAAVNAGEIEQKTYSGYDLGRNVVAKYGGKRMYNLGGMQMGMPRYGYAA
jgi:hypothetical protein